MLAFRKSLYEIFHTFKLPFALFEVAFRRPSCDYVDEPKEYPDSDERVKHREDFSAARVRCVISISYGG